MKNRILKSLTVTLLAGSMILASTPSLASSLKESNINENDYSILVAENNALEDGKYNLSIETLKEDSDELSMAGQYMNKKALLEVEGQNMYMTLTLTKIEWMQDIEILVEGSSVKYDLVKKGDNAETATVRFKVPNENPNVGFHMNVEPMGNARVKFKVAFQNDINKISGSTNKSNDVQDNTSTSLDESENVLEDTLPQTGSPITQRRVLALSGLAIVAGTLSLKKSK